MAYATLIHVEAKNPQRGVFTPNTKPNASQVAGFIDEAAGIIDTILTYANYDTPVDLTTAATSAKLVLRNANAVGAAYMAEWAAPVSDRRKEYEDMWESAQRMLRTMTLDLPRNASESLPRMPDSATTPFFSRDMVN